MSIFGIFLFFMLLLIILLILIDSAKNGITPTPSTGKERIAAIKLATPLDPNSIADLGAGFGTMAFSLAKEFPKAKVVAYETASVPCVILFIRKMVQPRSNLTIKRANFMNEDLSKYDLLYTYLYPKAMERLQEKLIQPKTTLISNAFAMPKWKPAFIWPVESKTSYSSIYLYRRNSS
ncbi:hypothetical protein [Halobacillus seohaensis]|uniref:Methyltransferase small domain-containing protein n=1 Tax=Halobacillus seohaensis TaxID=447421 RepID=A0ABW2EL53_9BACI